jgi:hypothetical protein
MEAFGFGWSDCGCYFLGTPEAAGQQDPAVLLMPEISMGFLIHIQAMVLGHQVSSLLLSPHHL